VLCALRNRDRPVQVHRRLPSRRRDRRRLGRYRNRYRVAGRRSGPQRKGQEGPPAGRNRATTPILLTATAVLDEPSMSEELFTDADLRQMAELEIAPEEAMRQIELFRNPPP